jgi:hypothetical protein
MNRARSLIRVLPISAVLIGIITSVGCESESNLDAAMNSGGGLVGGSAKATPPIPSLPKGTESDGSVGEDQTTTGLASTPVVAPEKTIMAKVSRAKPKTEREDFIIRVSPEAHERLIGRASMPVNNYLQVGDVVDDQADLEYLEFCDIYNEQRHYQFRTNGIKLLVLIPLVDLLHNAEIDFDEISSKFVIKLAKR